MGSDPFSSIQNTPEIAYTAAGPRYESDSDDAVPPAVGYAVRPKSGEQQRQQQQQDSGLGLRGVGERLSNLWRGQSVNRSPDERKRNSILSDSTAQTTRTSILTSGMSGIEEEARTSTVARPTIIHIPSRPGEPRRISMASRMHESSPLFSGRPLTRSPPSFGLAVRSPEPVIDESPELPPSIGESMPRDSDSSWDRLARNSLGIAYKDLIITEPSKVHSPQIQEDNWMKHDLLSPDFWPQPNNTSVNMVGIANTSPYNIPSEIPRLPPTTAQMTPRGGRAGLERRPSQASDTTLKNTPSLSSRSDGSSSIRTQRAWAPPNRPLPETPTRVSRVPLADRPNDLYYASAGDLQTPTKKNWKATRSMKSAKSMRSVWADDDVEDEGEWEDIRPPTTIDGWDDGVDSDGSFAVYI